MKRKYSFIFLLFFYFFSFSQTQQEFCKEWEEKIDSTTNLNLRLKLCREYLQKVDTDCKLNIYLTYAGLFEEAKKLDSTKYYYNKIIKITSHSKKLRYLATSYCRLAQIAFEEDNIRECNDLLDKAKKILKKEPNNVGWISYYDTQATIASASTKPDYYLANTYIDSIIFFFEHINDIEQTANAYHNKAINFGYVGDYESATMNFIKAAAIKEKTTNPIDLDMTYYSLGQSYSEMHQYELAKKYQEKSLKLAINNEDNFSILINYLMLAFENRKLYKYDDALIATDSALSIAKELNLADFKADSYAEKGWIYYEKNMDYSKAEYFFKKAYEIIDTTSDIDITIGILEGLIETLIIREKFDGASKYLDVLKKIIIRVDSPMYGSDLDKLYSKYYEKTGQYFLAMTHLKRHHKIKDSIANKDIITKVSDLEKKYEIQKKELQIVSLNKQKEDQEAITQKAKLKQNIFFTAALLLLAVLAIGIWLYRKLKHQKQNLTKAHNKLDEINSIKNRLFSIIAHDLRGMLLPFQRSGKIIKYHLDEGNNERAIEIAQEIEKNSSNLSNMLDNLLDWSLNQMNGYNLNPIEISIKEELQIIIKGFEEQAKFKSIQIDLKYETDDTVFIDKGAFHVIFRNLIGNALKYTENGNIIISFKKEGEIVKFKVNDSGIGMSSEQLEALFKLKNNKTTVGTQGEKGTGIGLNLVYRFVKLMKGDITVASEKRIGTSFNISLPILEANTETKLFKKPISA